MSPNQHIRFFYKNVGPKTNICIASLTTFSLDGDMYCKNLAPKWFDKIKTPNLDRLFLPEFVDIILCQVLK